MSKSNGNSWPIGTRFWCMTNLRNIRFWMA